MKKRFMSMLLVLCMVFTLFPSAVFAEEAGGATIGNTAIGTSSVTEGAPLCENHKTHDKDCGYIEAKEAQPCGDLLEDGSYSCAPVKDSGDVSGNTATPGDAEEKYVCDHSDGCGYEEAVDGADCTHECELCKDVVPALLSTPRTAITGVGYSYDPATTTLTISSDAAITAWKNDSNFTKADVTTVVIESGVTSINNEAFNSCTGLTSVTIPSGVTSIGENAFLSCTGLTSVTIAEGSELKTIGMSAFSGCTSLTSVSIPSSVITIDYYAFKDCTSLASVTFEGATPPTTFGEGVFMNTASGLKMYVPKDSVQAYKSVSNLAAYASRIEAKSDADTGYSYDPDTTTLTIDSNAGTTAWRDNPNITISDVTTVVMESGVTTIGDRAFSGCTKLDSVTFAEGSQLTTINQGAFSSCKSLASVTIPEGVTTIGNSAFSGCTKLDSVTFAEGSQLTTINQGAFSSCKSLASVTIPEGVTTIDNYAFKGCTELASVTFEGTSQLETIGNNAFYGCASLASVAIPEGVTTIGNQAFADCTILASVTFEGATPPTTFEILVFYGTASGLKIYVPKDSVQAYKSVSNLAAYASRIEAKSDADTGYSYDPDTTTLTIDSNAGTTAWGNDRNITISDVTTVVIESGVTTIGSSAFYGCTSLASVTFEGTSKLATIGNQAFAYCTSLASVTIPEGVTTIGDNTFNACSNLASVTFEGATPPTTFGSDVFAGTANTLKIYVPKDSVQDYKDVANIAAYASIISPLWDSTTITAASKVFPGDGVKFSTALPGNHCTLYYLKIDSTELGVSKQLSGASDTDKIVPIDTFEEIMGENGLLGTVPAGKKFSYWQPTDTTVTAEYELKELYLKAVFVEDSATVTEQFTLATGETYYFDLSGELGTVTNGVSSTIGTINVGKADPNGYPGVPDPTMHYVPFTYAGTVNAYSLESSSSGQTGSSAAATASDRSLFVAEYNVSHTKSWDGLNTANLIFGKTLDTNYKLRSLSVGSATANNPTTDLGGTPITNEWDSILGKSGLADSIKNWSGLESWGQDTTSSINMQRAGRGSSAAAKWNDKANTHAFSNSGWRPALEVLNADTLGADGLNAVTLNLNGGSFDSNGSAADGVVSSLNIVCAGATFNAPSGEGLTPPSGKTFDKWQRTGDTSTTYAAGTSITHTSGLGLTALWKDVTTVTAVTVSPETASVQKGTTQQFSAAVTGTNNPAQTVTWTVTGGTKSTINESGLLTVAADETAANLTVKATSTVDTSKSDTAAVTVTTTPVTKYTLTVTNGTGGGSFEENATVTATANAATSGQRFKEWTATGITLTDKTQNPVTFTMPAGAVSLTAVYEPIPAGTHTITSTAGTGGSISPSGSVSVSAGESKTFTISANSGYSISSVTVDGVNQGAISSYTFSNITDNHTISATFSYNGGGSTGGDGGGSSSGGSSNIIVTPPAPDKPNTPTEAQIKVDGKTDTNGTTAITITDKNITDAIAKAEADAKKNGNTANGVTIVLSATGGKNAQSVTVNLPKTVQDTIISKKVVSTIIVVDNPDVQIGMDLKAVTEINTQAKSDVNITAQRLDSSKLTGTAKTAIGSRPVFNLTVNYGSGKQVQSFGAGGVSVSIPYTLGANEKAGNVCAVYVDGSGKVQWLTSSVYDSAAKVLRFSTNHFSTYGVGYKQDAPAFTDIANHWAKSDIEYVVSRGLFAGTGATTFSPNTAMTRGMFVTALGRLANADVSSYKTSSFSDVKADSYYMGYIEWANKNGIVNGSDGKFMPDQSITREQMAVIMQNYAKTIGFTLPKAHEEKAFADSDKIGGYAKDAVKAMQMAGVLSGKSGNVFDPQGTATRAEVSAVLRRFVELRISIDTAQGWTMNDSGKWMYYENGKPVTGKKDIGGASYTFDQNGEMADVPKNLKYTTHTVVKNESWGLIAHKYGCSAAELARVNNKTVFNVIHPGDVLKVPQK